MKKCILILSLFCSLLAGAQSPSYCVYLVSGDVTVSDKTKKSEKIKLNQFVSDNQELTLSGKAQVTLVNKDAQYLMLNTAGTYKVSSLVNNLKNYPPGVTQKYVSLLWKDLVASQDNFSSAKKSAAAGVIGGVHRGDDCGALVFPSLNLRTSLESVRFIWKSIPKAQGYDLVVLDDGMTEILSKSVTDTQITINLAQDLKDKKGNLYWTIRAKGGKNCEIEPMPFERVTKEEEEGKTMTESAFVSMGDIISQLTAIDKMEKEGWIYRAFHFFDVLLKDNPGNRMLSGQYVMLLLQYGFNKEAEALFAHRK